MSQKKTAEKLVSITRHNSNLYAINNNKLNLVLYQSCSNSFFKDNLLLVIVISNNLIDGLLSKIYTCHDCIATFKHKMTLEQKNPWFLFSFLHFYTFAPDDGTRVLHLTLLSFHNSGRREKDREHESLRFSHWTAREKVTLLYWLWQ